MKNNYDVKLLQWLNKIIKYTLLMSKDSFAYLPHRIIFFYINNNALLT